MCPCSACERAVLSFGCQSSGCFPPALNFGKIRLVGRSGVLLKLGTQGQVCGWKGLANGTWDCAVEEAFCVFGICF